MKNMSKKLLCLTMTFIFCFNSLAAIVSDNDGSAFITKAEFDSLKNNFQSVLDSYNSQIDSKIDSAIAGYLAGIKTSKENDLYLDKKCMYSFPLIMDSNDNWNNKSTDYYSVSSPSFENRFYTLLTDQSARCGYVQPDPSAWTYLTIPAYNGDSYIGLISLRKEQTAVTGQSGFINMVGLISGTRNINGTNYNIRERINVGKGHDNILYISTGWSFNTHGGHWTGYSDDSKSSYQYFDVIGYGPGSRSGYNWVFNYADSNRKVWTSHSLPITRMGNGHEAVPIQPRSDFGTTYGSYVNKRNSLGDATSGGWFTNDTQTIDATIEPLVNVFSWDEVEKVSRVYAKNANVCAENQGKWRLLPRRNTTASTPYRELVISNNSSKWLQAWNTSIYTDGKVRPWYSFNYYLWPYFEAAPNTNTMPGDAEEFSQLPAKLVYYYDSNNKVHFLDEGMYLQKFEKKGKVKLQLTFSGNGNPSIKIYLSKKPFDYASTSADVLKMKVKGTEYTNGYTLNLSSERTVELVLDEVNKDDELYMYWEPTTITQFCQLESIDKFTIEYEN